MGLRALARPFISLAESMYKSRGLRRLAVELRDEFDDRIPVDKDEPSIRLHVASRMENQRAVSFFDKEPDTIAWLDQLGPDQLLMDIGANIGVYTLYAAIRRGARVIALEPESQNFAALNRNIFANRIGERVMALPVAASDQEGLTALNLSRFHTGGSHHSIHAPVGEGGRVFSPAFVQGTVAMKSDDLIKAIAPGTTPRFVKIDVDGAESRVVGGMKSLLADPLLEQVLIELVPEEPDGATIIRTMGTAGFSAQAPAHLYRGRGNYIFVRKKENERTSDRSSS